MEGEAAGVSAAEGVEPCWSGGPGECMLCGAGSLGCAPWEGEPGGGSEEPATGALRMG